MKDKIKRIQGNIKGRTLIILAGIYRLIFPMRVSAANKIQDTKLYKGTQNLLNDAITALTVITALVVIVLLIKHKYDEMTGEENDKPAAKKNFKKTLVNGVIIICAEVIVNVVFSYFI